MRSISKYEIAVIFFIVVESSYSQSLEQTDTTKTDSVTNEFKSDLENSDSIHLYQPICLLRFHLYKNQLTNSYSQKFNEAKFDDEFLYFRDSFLKSLQAAYKDQMKYDLGEFGKYLGVSKKLFAIILAILSL